MAKQKMDTWCTAVDVSREWEPHVWNIQLQDMRGMHGNIVHWFILELLLFSFSVGMASLIPGRIAISHRVLIHTSMLLSFIWLFINSKYTVMCTITYN